MGNFDHFVKQPNTSFYVHPGIDAPMKEAAHEFCCNSESLLQLQDSALL